MGDRERIAVVLAALARLRARNAEPLSQGLSPQNARRCLALACDAITAEGLAAELATPGRRPASVAAIAAGGVFTSPLEWVAMLAAAGCRVWLKAPSVDAAFCDALVEEGLAVPITGRAIPQEAEAILAFGGDETMASFKTAWPDRKLALYGHRFSVAMVHADTDLPGLARALTLDHALYDTRGCMAPVAIFALGDARALEHAMAEAMAQMQVELPRGAIEPSLGSVWRERQGLARARGRAHLGEGWGVLSLPAAHFLPFALPRMAVIHPVEGPDEVAIALAPWRAWLSSCATNLQPERATSLGVLRVCAPGSLQIPAFPRRHDGRPMLGSLVLD